MALPKITYLEWARRYMGKYRLDLACSAVKPVARDEFPFTAEQISLHWANTDTPTPLHERIAKRYNVPLENVMLTHGATQAIYLACMASLSPGDEVFLEQPHYEPLQRVLAHAGAQIKPLDRAFEHGFQIDLEELERSVSRSTRALVMTNLHNPSGVATNPERMEAIGQILRGVSSLVICSEVYLDSAFNDGHKPAAAYGPHMVSISSLSKVYGLAGLRAGWLVAEPSIIERARIAGDYISAGPSVPSMSLATLALDRAEAHIKRCQRIVTENLKAVRQWVQQQTEFQWIEPDGATVCLLKLPPGIDSRKLSDRLRERHETLVVPGDFFWMHGFIRISVGTDPAVLKEGLQRIEVAMKEIRR